MGIFNLGGTASAFSTSVGSIAKKPSFWDNLASGLKTGLSTYTKITTNYETQRTLSPTYTKPVTKKSNTLLYVGGGAIALVAMYFIMK